MPADHGAIQPYDRAALIFLCGILLLWAQLSNPIFNANFQQYRYLAESFLAGRLDFLELTGTSWGDSAPYRKAYYWPLGILPALLMTPFVWLWRWFGAGFQQGYINFGLILWTSYLVFSLAKKYRHNNHDAAWLTLGFFGSSSYLSVALVPWSWHLSHVVAVWLLLMAIHEYLGGQRWTWIGLLVGMVFASRQTAGLAVLGFAALLLSSNRNRSKNPSDLVQYFVGFGAVVSMVLFYNYLRFDSPFESGYSYQAVPKPDGALFGVWNFWQNFRVFFFNIPIAVERMPYFAADPFGMSIYVVSPWLLLLRPKTWHFQDTLLAANIAIIAGGFLLWWSTGSNQLGYRFSLDFMPFLYWLMLRTDAVKITPAIKIIIAISVPLNLYFLTKVFNG